MPLVRIELMSGVVLLHLFSVVNRSYNTPNFLHVQVMLLDLT
jgi:hypothetical protein